MSHLGQVGVSCGASVGMAISTLDGGVALASDDSAEGGAKLFVCCLSDDGVAVAGVCHGQSGVPTLTFQKGITSSLAARISQSP
jgi:hypothetical protein